MDGLIECMKETRTWRQWIKLLWQKLYLRKLFKRKENTWTCGGVVTKRAMAKALRNRLADLSREEAYLYEAQKAQSKLVQKNKKERLMIHSILEDMYDCGITPDYLGTD